MKNLKVFMSACLLACSTMASAQFTTGGSNATSTTTTADTEGWSKVWVSYDPMTVNVDVDGAEDIDLTGISFGLSKSFSISQSMPLFVEAGAGLTYAWGEDDETYEDLFTMKYSLLSLKVPVNLQYRFAIPNSSVAIIPYAGVSFRFNFMGKCKNEFGDDMKDLCDEYGVSESKAWELIEDKYGIREETNMFDEDEVGNDDYTWKRFQMGWQIGANVEVGQNFVVGVQYGKDFSELCKDTKISTTSISVGYKF